MSVTPKHARVRVWGRGWLGVMRIRVWPLNDRDYKTFWHLFIWKMSFGFSLPPFIADAISEEETP